MIGCLLVAFCTSDTEQRSVELQHSFGSGSVMKLVNVLGDDRALSSLLGKSTLQLGNGQMCRIGLFASHQLSTIVIKLPDQGWIPEKIVV